MLLMRGAPDAVASWARRGVVPVHVGDLQGWTAVLPAGASRARPPYDDALSLLAGRPVSSRLRTAVGLFMVQGNAVVTIHPAGWRALQRWFVWAPRHGVVHPRELVAGRPSDLVKACGIRDRVVQRQVRDILVDSAGDALGVLGDLVSVLSLPGGTLLDGTADPATMAGHQLVEPDPRKVARFDETVTQDARQRAELEGR